MSRPRLTYFSSRGILEPVRVVLAVANVDYEMVNVGTYNVDNQPEGFVSLVQEKKLPFDALPLWEEDGLSLVQSSAILRYTAAKYGLAGKDEKERALADMYSEGIRDLVMAARDTKEKFFGVHLPKWLTRFENALEKNGTGYLVGSDITFADTNLWYLLDNWVDQGLNLDQYPQLQALKQRVAEKPGLKKYLESGQRFPIQPSTVFKQ
jgi:glutathione S-transferase